MGVKNLRVEVDGRRGKIFRVSERDLYLDHIPSTPCGCVEIEVWWDGNDSLHERWAGTNKRRVRKRYIRLRACKHHPRNRYGLDDKWSRIKLLDFETGTA